MGYGHVDDSHSAPPIVSRWLAGQPDPATYLAGPDPGVSLPLSGAACHRRLGGLPVRQRHRNDHPGEDRRRARSLHRAGQLPGAIQQRAVPAHSDQHRRLYRHRGRGQVRPRPQHGPRPQSGALLQQPVSFDPVDSLGHSDGHVGPELALDLRRRQRAHQQRPGASESDRRDDLVAVRPAPRDAVRDHRGGLARDAVFHDELPGGVTSHSEGALRSCGNRRSLGAPAVLVRHAAPLAPDLHHRRDALRHLDLGRHPVRPCPHEWRPLRSHDDLPRAGLSPGAGWSSAPWDGRGRVAWSSSLCS